MGKTYQKLCLILGDQLNQQHSWFQQKEEGRLFVLMECLSETNYVPHHIQKVVGFFLAMRAFGACLENQGHEVHYLRLQDGENRQSIPDNIKMLVKKHSIQHFAYQLPDEYRLDQALQSLCAELDIETEAVDSEHFLSSRETVAELFAGKKQFLMETFYREMRQRYDILMEPNGRDPLTGRWNYDRENRHKLPKSATIPEPLHFSHEVKSIVKLIEDHQIEHRAKLPGFYWTADTKMKCLREAIGQSLNRAYAQHIQRLMVTGNFALLLGVDPAEVDEWYLGIYMDAIEWVEITNTRGMSQYTDGGIVGTKPYVSSANYLNKMSYYCRNCSYKHTEKYGEGACPLNSLYWDFYDRHRKKPSANPRVSMMYRVWDKMDSQEKEAILKQADQYKKQIEDL